LYSPAKISKDDGASSLGYLIVWTTKSPKSPKRSGGRQTESWLFDLQTALPGMTEARKVFVLEERLDRVLPPKTQNLWLNENTQEVIFLKTLTVVSAAAVTCDKWSYFIPESLVPRAAQSHFTVYLIRQIEFEPSSVTSNEPSRAMATPAGRPQTCSLSTTKPVRKSSYSPVARPVWCRGIRMTS
jgi:hypothetical protein